MMVKKIFRKNFLPLLLDDHALFHRDICQFVPYRKFSEKSIQQLAKETLAEVPRQVEKYLFIQVEIIFSSLFNI